MKGTLVNTVAIVAGSGLGLLLRRGIPERFQRTVMQGLSLAVALVGLQMALKTENVLVVIFSMAAGAIVGEALKIDTALDRFGRWIAARLNAESGTFGQAFISTSLMFCVGAMAIVGAIQDGLSGDPATLYAKSMIDGVVSAVFASTLGPGVALSAVSVLVYQGSITLLAGWLGSVLEGAVVREVTAVGGVLIIAISLSMLEIKKINVANLLPAVPVAAAIALIWPA